MSRNVLGVFAKQPVPGQVKSRLALATSPAWAAQVAEAFLLDWIAKLERFPATRVLVFTPAESQSYFREIAPADFAIEPQASGDLGARMQSFMERRLARGEERVVIIGADSPSLPIDYLHQAFAALAETGVVLGPARDGGYYLVGCARRMPDIFSNIRWGEATVLQETVARLENLGIPFALLPEWYDVDTLDDWQALCEEVRSGKALLPRTEGLITGDPKPARLSAPPHDRRPRT